MSFITINNIWQEYGDHVVLERINLQVKEGEFCSMVGASGCGKSTFLRLLLGQEKPTRGDILLDGQPLAAERPEEYRKLFSAVFTDVWLFDRLLGPQGEEADPALVATWLERLQMAHKLQLENGKTCGCRKGRRSAWRSCWRWPSPGTSFCWMNGRRIRIRISAASSTRSCCR